MELSRNLLCRKLGVEKGVLDFVNGLLFYQFFGGLSTDSPDDGGEIFRCDTKDGGIIADGIMLTEILLYRLTEAEVDVNITRTVAVCFALEQMVILVDAEILYAILHAIDYFLPLQKTGKDCWGYLEINFGLFQQHFQFHFVTRLYQRIEHGVSLSCVVYCFHRFFVSLL